MDVVQFTHMPMMWPTLTVQNIERSLSFYRDQLGLEQDLDLRDETGALFLASVEVDHTVIMLTRVHASTPQGPHRSGVRLTLLFAGDHDIDALLQRLLAGGTEVCSSIGNRPWGHRDFTVFDPDGYQVTIARPLEGSNSG
jgi:uncharacterized glyoxalase superfamily protein PhnB